MNPAPFLTPQYSEKLTAYKNEFQEILAGADSILAMSKPSELVKSYERDGSINADSLHGIWAPLQERMAKFTKLNPIYQAGLGNTHYSADFMYWGRMERLELMEALWLSVGLDPRRTWEKDLRFGERTPGREHRETAHVLSLKEQLSRFAEAQHGGSRNLDAAELLAWIEATDFPVHTGFVSVLQKIKRRKTGGPIEAPRPVAAPTDNREIDTMAKLFTAMAIDSYGYVPRSRKSPIPKEIEGISDRLGLSVSRDTILKYLRRGAELMPKEE